MNNTPSRRWLVTGFGPFGPHDENPSAILAASLDLPYEILPVTWSAAEDFLVRTLQDPPERLLMLGVHGKAKKFHLERQGRNRVGGTPDVDGVIREVGPIEANAPAQLPGTLWPKQFRTLLGERLLTNSLDAGMYLCNYSYFRALQVLRTTRVGFLHVPTFEVIDRDEQTRIVRKIVGLLDQR